MKDEPDRRTGALGVWYYVTVRDGKRVGWLAGPYMMHEDALAKVDEAREKAYEADPKSHFYAFGTASTHNADLQARIKPVFGHL